MAKETKKEKATETKKRKAAPKRAKAAPPAAEEPPPLGKAIGKIPAIAKKITRKASPKKAPAPTISRDDIALRAYYIAERRHQLGVHGDAAGDWIEAERQIYIEAGLKPPRH